MYRKKIEPARTFLDFALYVTFFPQLVAGPIVRAQELISQFYEEKKAKNPKLTNILSKSQYIRFF